MIHSYKFDISAAVDKTIINKFTPEHLKSMESLINLEAHPSLYGDNFETIFFDGFHIIDSENISLDTKQLETTSVTFQKARRGGGVTDKEEKELDTSLTTKGVVLSVPPGAVYERGDKNYIYITGQTRDGRYVKYNFSNRLVAVYKRKDGFTDDEIRNELSQLGNIFNPKNLPQFEAKEYDIIDEGTKAIDVEKWIDRDDPNVYQLVYDRIKPQCEAVGIGKNRQSYLAMTILNNTDDKPVLPMTQEKAKTWLDGSKYKDIKDKVRYVVLSYDFVSKGQVTAVGLAKKYPNEEVRVIVHCGIIINGIEQYTTRLTKFWVDWHTQLDNYSDVYFGGAPIKPKNLVLYGGVPQVTEEFGTDQVCLFVQDSVEGEFTQKLNGKLRSWS
tara:strand:- start:145 stop:1299 length:1155 start_codon:yes stop_codon:yes gene_type:complete